MSALAGTLVVSLEQAVAAPYCARLLAEAGARVLLRFIDSFEPEPRP